MKEAGIGQFEKIAQDSFFMTMVRGLFSIFLYIIVNLHRSHEFRKFALVFKIFE